MPVLAPSTCTDLTLGTVVCTDLPMASALGIQDYAEVKNIWATYADVKAGYVDYLAVKYDEQT